MGVHKLAPFLYKKRDRNPLHRNGVYGVDVSCILYAIISCASVSRRLTRRPIVSVKAVVATWCDEWLRAHKFVQMGIKLVFVFDGVDNALKKLRRINARKEREKWERTAANATTWQEVDKANGHLARVIGHVVRAFLDWAKSTLQPGKCFAKVASSGAGQ